MHTRRVSSVVTDSRVAAVQARMDQSRAAAEAMRVEQPSGVHRPAGTSSRRAAWMVLRGRVNTIGFAQELFAHRPISHVGLGADHIYALSDPDLIWESFAGMDAITTRTRLWQRARVVFGNGLFMSEGAEHRRNRALVQPTFSPRRIRSYADQMVDAAESLDRRWQHAYARGRTDINIGSEMSAITLDVVGRTLFGVDLIRQAPDIAEAVTRLLTVFRMTVSPIGDLLVRVPSPARTNALAALTRLDEVVDRAIADKRAQLAAGTSADDMLSVLIEARDPQTGQGMSDAQIRDEVTTIILAGHETTATALSWTLLELANNPEVLLRAQREWDSFGADHRFSFGDYRSLPYTQALLHESIRRHPPVWLLGRRVTEDVELGGYEIPAGSGLLACQLFMHNDPTHWRAPTRFDPTRWLDDDGAFDERNARPHPGAFFPFGFASRRCLGDRFALLEGALLLASIGRDWHVVPSRPGVVRPATSITMRPDNGIPARLAPRR